MSTTLPHGIIQINEGNISWYGDITANWQLIDSKIGEYDAAIASIPAPANTGTLTINYGGTTIAMFGADDAGNVSADIPAPGDGALTVTYGGSTLGSFNANQATPETIDIPAPGDGTLTIQLNGVDVQTFTANQSGNATANIVTPAINNGTLTIRLNGVDVQTFTANQANDVVADIIPPVPGDGTLTIQKNGTNVATFTANASTNATANIVVPTAVSELTNDSNFVQSSDLATVATSGNYNDLSNKPTIPTVNNATLTIQQNGTTLGTFTANASVDKTININTADDTKIPLAGSNQISGDLIPATDGTVNLGSPSYQWNQAYIKSLTINGTAAGDILTHNANEFVPRSGGAVMSGTGLGRTDNTAAFLLSGGTNWDDGSFISLHGKNHNNEEWKLEFGSSVQRMQMLPNGTWTWTGAAVQLISDQRYKQQISQIDDKLLDAWEDVNLVQFKYNDAVDEKGKDKARLHTGYVVQQIDNACKSHGIDVSKYGLYCHEEYPEETEEVEVEQADGTKTKERKVIREASEHYSLRYTEVYAVECMYLRRCIARLTARIEELEKGKEQEAGK